MSDTFSFKSVDGFFHFTVKMDFLKRCNNPETIGVYDLITKHKLSTYFHNEQGPAIIRLKDSYSEYWLNGFKVSDEEAKHMAHNYEFNNKLLDTIK